MENKRIALAKKVIELAYSMDMWVFGGYVRDVVVRRQTKFGDIDLCCSQDVTDVTQFVRVLGSSFTVDTHDVRVFKHTYGAMSPGIRRLHKCTVTDSDGTHVRVDVVMYDDSFKEWCRERTVDFTCNLFYMKRDVSLGIRYVPDFLKYNPNPMKVLIGMTVSHEFHRMWDIPKTSRPQWQNVLRIHDRAKDLVRRGWHVVSTPVLMSELMSLEIVDKPWACTICCAALRDIEDIQSRRAVSMLEQGIVSDRIQDIMLS